MKFIRMLIFSSVLALTACHSLPVNNAVKNTPDMTNGVLKSSGDDDQDGVLNESDQCPNTPLNVVVTASGCPLVESYTDCYEPPQLRMFFDTNNSYPKDQYLPELKKVVELMTKYPKSIISIEGHASKADKNPDKISHDRALVIAQILKEKYSISERRIVINFYGTKRPIAPSTTEEGRAMNQRIYAVIHSQ